MDQPSFSVVLLRPLLDASEGFTAYVRVHEDPREMGQLVAEADGRTDADAVEEARFRATRLRPADADAIMGAPLQVTTSPIAARRARADGRPLEVTPLFPLRGTSRTVPPTLDLERDPPTAISVFATPPAAEPDHRQDAEEGPEEEHEYVVQVRVHTARYPDGLVMGYAAHRDLDEAVYQAKVAAARQVDGYAGPIHRAPRQAVTTIADLAAARAPKR